MLKHNEEFYELNRPDEVKCIKFNKWELSGLIVQIDYTRTLKQILNGEFMKDELLEDHGHDGKNV
jgi:hypothetical protein